MKSIHWIGICALAFVLSSCQSVNPTPYLPPASNDNLIPFLSQRGQAQPANTPLSLPGSTAQPGQDFYLVNPTDQPDCIDSLRFVEDLTVPDGSAVLPGASVDKRWRVENNGTCNWNERYRLKFSSGYAFSGTAEQALFPARSGSQAMLRLVFPAPEEPGTYRSTWQAYNPKGDPFGDVIFLEIVVQPQD